MDWLTGLKTAIDYMEEHLLEDISAEDVAGAVYLSPSYFHKCFKIMTGYTIGEYLRNRRLYLAALEVLKRNVPGEEDRSKSGSGNRENDHGKSNDGNREDACAGGGTGSSGERKVIDLAYKYGYDTPESFTRAFTRFHGLSPMQLRSQPYRIKVFLPLIVEISE